MTVVVGTLFSSIAAISGSVVFHNVTLMSFVAHVQGVVIGVCSMVLSYWLMKGLKNMEDSPSRWVMLLTVAFGVNVLVDLLVLIGIKGMSINFISSLLVNVIGLMCLFMILMRYDGAIRRFALWVLFGEFGVWILSNVFAWSAAMWFMNGKVSYILLRLFQALVVLYPSYLLIKLFLAGGDSSNVLNSENVDDCADWTGAGRES